MTVTQVAAWTGWPLFGLAMIMLANRTDMVRIRRVRTQRALAPIVAALDRPIKLIGVALVCAVVAACVDLVFDQGHLLWRFFTPRHGEGPEWKDLFQALLLILGLPVGLMLWHWRDLSVRQQVENARKDTTLKEFSELQLRAAGAIDEKLPFGARVALQVAALHQLRPYLRGEYGPSFRLAAFELVLSVLDGRVRDPSADVEQLAQEEEALGLAQFSVVPRRVHQAVRDIVYEEWSHVFTHGSVLTRRSLQGIRFPDFAELERIDFVECDLSSASFAEVDLNSCYFTNCTLDGVEFRAAALDSCTFDKCGMIEANFFDARLTYSRMTNCDLGDSDWRHAVLRDTQLDRDDLRGANMTEVLFQDSVVYRCELERTDLREAQVAASAFGAVDWSLPLLDGFAFDDATALDGQPLPDEPPYPSIGEQLRGRWATMPDKDCDDMRGQLYARSASRSAPDMSRLNEPISRSVIPF